MDSAKYIHNAMTSVPGPSILILKEFADSSYIQQGGYLNRDLSTGQYQIATSRDPAFNDNLARKLYVDNQDNLRVLEANDTMTGDLNMQNNVLSVSNPTNDNHLTRKAWVLGELNNKLGLSGGNMTGDINMGNHKIISTNHRPTHETIL